MAEVDINENYMRIPKPMAPAEVGGKVTDAQYIMDGEQNQHEINEKKVDDVESPQEDGMYVRKNGTWSKLEINYDPSTETLIINTEPVNNN